jgi:hypothetical protein
VSTASLSRSRQCGHEGVLNGFTAGFPGAAGAVLSARLMAGRWAAQADGLSLFMARETDLPPKNSPRQTDASRRLIEAPCRPDETQDF